MSKNPFGFTLDPRHVLRYGTVMKHPTKAKASKVTSSKQIQYKGVSIYPSDNGYRVSIDRDSLFDSVKDAKQFVDKWKRNPASNKVGDIFLHKHFIDASGQPSKFIITKIVGNTIYYRQVEPDGSLTSKWKANKEYFNTQVVKNPATKKSAADFQQSYTDHLEIVSSPEFSNATLKQKALMLTGVDMREKLGNPTEWKKTFYIIGPDAGRYYKVYVSHKGEPHQYIESAANRDYLQDAWSRKKFKEIDKPERNPFLASAIEGLATGTGITLGASLMAPVVARSVKKALKGISNPSIADAAELSQQFHGRAANEVLEVTDTFQSRTNLTMLGCLVELELLCDNRSVIPLDFKTSNKKEMVYLASDPAGNQLYIVGGNQSLPLEDIETVDSSELEKDFVTVGVVHSCSYFTDKHHLSGPVTQKQGETYWHVFAEDGGEKPVLVFDKLNKQLQLVGGSYKVKDVGIVN